MFDITTLPAYYLEKYGRAVVSEVVGEKTSVVAMWEKRGKFPLAAVQKLLEHDPEPLGKITPLYTNPEPGKKLAFLVPLSSPPEPKMVDSLVKLYDKREMNYKRVAFNNLSVARNALAAWALRGPYQKFWWQDGDSLCQAGDAAWFKKAADLPMVPDTFAGLNSIYRALVHKKTIVSVCYRGRANGAPPQFGGGETQAMRMKVRQGCRDEVIEVPWSGMGGMLTDRSVFEDIIKTQGDEIRMKPGGIGARFNYQYDFFGPIDRETPGDDVPFCARARRAGHKIYVDLALQAAHIGDRAYTFKDL